MGEPPCSKVYRNVCRRRSPLLLQPRGNTPSGLEDPSCPPLQPSRRCGSLSRSTMRLVRQSFTGNASRECIIDGLCNANNVVHVFLYFCKNLYIKCVVLLYDIITAAN